MLVRSAKHLVITPPPTRAERRAMEQYAAAQLAGDAETADKLAAALAMTQTRITVACLNTLQYGRYEANRRQVAPWMVARGGKTVDDLIATDAGALLIEAGLRWARANAAVTAVETRTGNRVTDVASEWQAADWPQLESIDAFVDEVPGDLVEALDALIFDINPGLFRFGEGDADTKKNGGISAG